MRTSSIKEVEETQEEVKVDIKVKEKKSEEATEKRTDSWKEKLGRKKLNKDDKATIRVSLNFSPNEIMMMERAMQIENINKDSGNARAVFIKKMVQRQMLRNGYEF